ncbi:hypothetical protein BC936DRAFT_145693 [Jimgerdemannia flammicorona]|uniref:TRP C-terminal domain-containing protein n=1 Tax=Jimgerdemannia flammicorona TaxID=994334 RepID=A0A433D9B4_9FUNG|nr:hypothetical protein BC936DRAFT_145693 [Jimgerdemannia flammicorona]
MLAHRRAISSLPSLPSLLLLVLLCATVVRASDLDQLYGYNWTLCQNTTTYFNISTVYRHYDPLSKTYNFSIAGYSPVDVNNVSAAYNAIATSYTFARLAFWDTFNDVKALCDSVVTGCPIKKGNITIINKSFRVPGSAFPLGDIQASFRALTGDLQNFTCIDIAPIGYQNPIWRQIFIWVPVGIALFAAMVSIISTLISGPTEDFYVLTSNYALEPIALRLKTPGFFDVLHYAQFIVASGQLSLRYPKFYPLFVSDFAWSSLLFPGEYLNNAAALWYESSSTTPLPDSTAATSNANVPGLSLNKRLLRLWSRQVDSSGPPTVGDSDVPVVVNITGTGMVNFANSVGLDARALFLSVLIYFLMIMAAILVLCLLFLLVVEYLGCWYPYRFAGQRKKIFNFAIGECRWRGFGWTVCFGVFRLLSNPTPLPLLPSSDDHVLLPVDASSALVRKPDGLTGPLLPSPGGSGLYRLLPPAPAPAHHHLRRHQPPTQFFIVILVYKLFVGAMTGLFQTSGITQAVGIILLELLLFLALWFKRPHSDEAINIIYVFFAAMRIVVSVLNILYVEQFPLPNDAKQYIAYSQVFLHCVAFLVFFAIPAKNLIAMCWGITPQEPTTETNRRRTRASSLGRPLATSHKERWRRSGSNSAGSNIVLTQGMSGSPANLSVMATSMGWGGSGISGEDDPYKDKRESYGPEDLIAWRDANPTGVTGEARPISGYEEYSQGMQANLSSSGLGGTTPHRRTSLNDQLGRTQSLGGIGGFYRHSRRSMRRMSKTLEDLAAQATAVAAYQAAGTSAGASYGAAYADSPTGSNPGGYYGADLTPASVTHSGPLRRARVSRVGLWRATARVGMVPGRRRPVRQSLRHIRGRLRRGSRRADCRSLR